MLKHFLIAKGMLRGMGEVFQNWTSTTKIQFLMFITCRRMLNVNFWRPWTSSNIATFLESKDETSIANNNFTGVKSL